MNKQIDDLMEKSDEEIKTIGEANGSYAEQPNEIDVALHNIMIGIQVIRMNFNMNERLLKTSDNLLNAFEDFLKSLYDETVKHNEDCNCGSCDSTDIPVEKLSLTKEDIKTTEGHDDFSAKISKESKQKAKDIIDSIS